MIDVPYSVTYYEDFKNIYTFASYLGAAVYSD